MKRTMGRILFMLAVAGVGVLAACGAAPQQSAERADSAGSLPAPRAEVAETASPDAIAVRDAEVSVTLPREFPKAEPSLVEFRAQVERLFFEKDYAGLEALARAARKTRAQYGYGWWQLHYFYSHLDDLRWDWYRSDRDGFFDRLLEWEQQFPDSITAKAALMGAYLNAAWEERGSGWGSELNRGQVLGFRSFLKKARTVGRAAERLDENCPEYYEQRIRLATGAGEGRRVRWRVFEEGMAQFPSYSMTYDVMTVACLPRWGGDSGEIIELADRSVEWSRHLWQQGAYFMVAAEVAGYGGGEEFLAHGFDWQRLQVAYKDLCNAGAGNRYNHNRMAWFACALHDREAAQQYLPAIADCLDPYIWSPTGHVVWTAWMEGKTDVPRSHPIHEAAREGNFEAVQREIDQGVPVDQYDDHGRSAYVIAFNARHWNVVRYLLEQGADPRQRSLRAWPPLARAASRGQAWLVQELLDYDVDVNERASNGWTALHLAARRGYTSIARLLLAHPDIQVNAVTYDDDRPVKEGERPNRETYRLTHTSEDAFGATPLLRAINEFHMDVALLLLEHGADANRARNDGWHPLTAAVDAKDIEMVTALLAHGADPNHQDHDGWSPLHMAAMNGCAACLTPMLAVPGVDVNLATNSGETPAHRAAKAGHVDVLEILVEHGADLRSLNKGGRTPLEMARAGKHEAAVAYLEGLSASP